MYVAHDAEPLQFYLWYLDYCKRFDALPADARALSPEWHFDAANSSSSAWPTTSDNKDMASTTFDDVTPAPAPVRSFSRLGQYPTRAPQINPHNHVKSLSRGGSQSDGDFPTLAISSADDEGLTALPKRQMNEDEARNYVSRSAQAQQLRMGQSGSGGADEMKWSGCKLQNIFHGRLSSAFLTLTPLTSQSRFSLFAPK